MPMDFFTPLLTSFIPSCNSVYLLLGFLSYLGISGSVLPGNVVAGASLADGTRLHYRCNGKFLATIIAAFRSRVWFWIYVMCS
ncbi:putative delta(14)-sterol reductase [Helianthus annuus]|nr:putative delta(14)-sterol reductase [Helianthus annuus]KAJ0892012.1 putative delta(14)-sterol reductase [Helianthus annuus]